MGGGHLGGFQMSQKGLGGPYPSLDDRPLLLVELRHAPAVTGGVNSPEGSGLDDEVMTLVCGGLIPPREPATSFWSRSRVSRTLYGVVTNDNLDNYDLCRVHDAGMLPGSLIVSSSWVCCYQW